ncbi:MAG: manganese-binding transcriptional regulator MntR [Phycisphaerae bacterium]|nr:manganese-binding transcriptional regulator MntR [Phycisphaerae bacterium]
MPRRASPRPATRSSAASHRRVRADHAAETAQDYAEAIADLIDQRGEARVTDIALALGVSHVTVVRTIGRLRRDGLVTALPYRSVFLTKDGRAIAEEARRRHRIVLAFLRALGVSAATADTDAEGIEHHVSDETLRAMERFAARAER